MPYDPNQGGPAADAVIDLLTTMLDDGRMYPDTDDTRGGMVLEFVLVVAALDPDGDTRYTILTPDTSKLHSAAGLLDFAQEFNGQRMGAYVAAVLDEGDDA